MPSDNSQILSTTINNSDQYQIRSMRETDIDIVTDIDHYTWNNSSWTSEDFFHALQHPLWNCWILEGIDTDHLILGYGLQHSSDNESRIANLCIHPNRRGYGLGEFLLRHMINYAHRTGAWFIELQVDTSNIRAFRLYVKHGFTVVRLLPQYYSDNTDGYLMQLRINRLD
jgi:ribosomal-protein-alanine N-acetyltransferase